MRIEVTGRIFKDRCEVRTEWCHARACGAVGDVTAPDGTHVNVCGACLHQMVDAGRWEIAGARPQPWPVRRVLDEGEAYAPKPDALIVEPAWILSRGRCEVQTERCEARGFGVLTAVTRPDCRDVRLCGACLEKMAVSGAWDLGRDGGAAVAEIKRLTLAEAAAPAA